MKIQYLSIFFAVALATGQLIKLPPGANGLTFLDLTIATITIWALLKAKFHLQKPPFWFFAASFFALICLTSQLFSPLHLALLEKLISLGYLARFLLYLLFAWVIFSKVLGNFTQIFRDSILLAGTSLSILGLFQIIFLPNLYFLSYLGWDPHFFRVVSTFLDPNFLGSFLIFTLLLLTITIKLPKSQKLLSIAFLLNYLALVGTFSRSSDLMFAFSFIILSLLKRSLKLFILTIILSLGIGLSYHFYNSQIAKPKGIDRQKSGEYRLGSWQIGLKMFNQSPIFGVGFNSYRFALKEYQLAPNSIIEGHGGSSNDSSLLTVASTTGIIGLFSYLIFLSSLLFASFKSFFQHKNPLGAVLFAVIIGLIINSFFINSLFYPWSLFLILTSAALLKEKIIS
ncbi:MAG: O-antigen ligase family protein [Candidatus Daviesbacteria bacterium]|nr:O-antigen ligase family protein [Candidatus Daviesbacteria bacterium]